MEGLFWALCWTHQFKCLNNLFGAWVTYLHKLPYFLAYNARVIYTKTIWNRKKWTCAVYVRKISER